MVAADGDRVKNGQSESWFIRLHVGDGDDDDDDGQFPFNREKRTVLN